MDRTLPPGAPDTGQRLFLPVIEFDEWTDYLAIQAAVDDECVFLEPLFDDDSTAYPPLQVFWVIYDKESDVKDGDEVINTYFDGDVIRAGDFPRKNGLAPLGFKFPTDLQQSFLSVEETRTSDGGRTLDAKLGSRHVHRASHYLARLRNRNLGQEGRRIERANPLADVGGTV